MVERAASRAIILRPAMPKTSKKKATAAVAPNNEKIIRVRLRALEIPPVKDGVVIGRDAAIGGEAMSRTLRLMSNEKFEHVVLNDDIVQDVIVRGGVLRKLGRERLLNFILERVKPVMTETEILMLDIHIELVMEDAI